MKDCLISLSVTNWITVFSVIAVISGWFVNGWLNRRNEIAKKRFDHRLPTLHSFLELIEFIKKNNQKPNDEEFIKLTRKVHMDFQLYGQKDEIDRYEIFLKAWEANNNEVALDALNNLIPLVMKRIRKELGIKQD
jgi:hypothetical protein